MSYQVLARKWRPKTFAELAGQEHVVTALTNALTRGRLHHAYLLTGTRGVGKTTIARILAKSLNCATGVTATPCGVCAACVDIDAGRFVDLLELDAASNTGIDNMREILDNARYAPTVGRYKVYLIDEVHMLSKAAFNSMLKTLEEPPEHVKFVLATTDPQKIPVTVLSRVLQFNLKQLPAALIAERLAAILVAESIASDPAALALLARAAQGSMRDALSLLDQAIAYGGGEVRDDAVRAMLGAVDTEYVYRIAEALIAADGAALLAEADAMAERSVSFASALDELASLYHRIAVAQAVPAAAETFDDAERVAGFASRTSAEQVQLAYQICVQSRADLALAPDEATGFSMALLRLLAFEPAFETAAFETGVRPRSVPASQGGRAGSDPNVLASQGDRAGSDPNVPASQGDRAGSDPNVPASQGDRAGSDPDVPTSRGDRASSDLKQDDRAGPDLGNVAQARDAGRTLPQTLDAWPGFVADLKLTGIAGQLAAQSALVRCEGRLLTLAVPATHKHLVDPTYADRLRAALEQATGQKVKLAFEVADAAPSSLAAQVSRERAEQKAAAEAAFRDEPFVRDLVSRFDATVKPESIKPIS